MRGTLIAAALGATLLLAACGGSDEPSSGTTSTSTSQPTSGSTTEDAGVVDTITLVDNAFEPGDVAVAAGELELVNDGASPHNFSIEGTDVDVDVDAGEDGHATLDLDPGTYTMFCEFHRTQGMEGTLTVT